MSDNVEVKLSAQTDQLRAAMQMAATSVGGSLKEMGAALSSFNSNVKRAAGGTYSFGEDVKHAMGVAAGNMLIATVGMGKAMLALIPIAASAAAGIAVALLGVGVFAMLRMQEEVQKLENVMGMSSDEATRMAVALRLIGKEADDYTAIALKLANGIKTDESRMKELGIQTRDTATGALLPMNTIMQNAFTTMQTYKAGTDQAAFAQEVFQRSAQGVYEVMANLPDAMERSQELVEKLNIEMGPNAQKAIDQYKLQMGSLRVMVDVLATKVGQAVMPALNGLAQYFLTEGPGAIDVIVTAIKYLLAALSLISTVVKAAWEVVSVVFSNIGTQAQTLGQVVWAAFKGNWSEIPGIIDAGYKKVEARAELAKKRLTDIHAQLGDSLGALFGPQADAKEAPGKGPLGSGDRGYTAKAKKEHKGPHDQSVMQYLEADLKAQQDAFNQMKLDQGSFETWSNEQTLAYWQNILTSDLLGTKDRLAVNNKFYDAKRIAQEKAFKAEIAGMEAQRAGMKHNLEAQVALVEEEYRKVAQRYGAESTQAQEIMHRLVAIRQQLADQRIKIADLEAKREAAIAEHAIAMDALAADQAVALRRMSAEQRLAVEEAFENKLYAIRLRQLELDKAAHAGDVVAVMQIQAQIEALTMAHQSKLTQIANAAELERQQFAIQAAQAVQDTVGNTIAALITKTKDWKDILKDAVKSLTASLNQLAGNAIAKQLFGAGTTGGNMIGDLASKIFGGKGGGAAAGADPAAVALTSSATALTTSSTLLDTAATTTSTALTLAATGLEAAGLALTSAATALAAAGAAKAGSGLVDAAVNMFSGTAGYAVGTPYVPQDSLAFVHKGEAIIPAKYNNGGLGGGFNNVNQFQITGPIDTRTQHQIMTSAAKGVKRASLRGGG